MLRQKWQRELPPYSTSAKRNEKNDMKIKGIKLQDGAQTTILCKHCQLSPPNLIVRTNRKTGGQFLGCPNFPECTYKEPIPESMYMQVLGQEQLL